MRRRWLIPLAALALAACARRGTVAARDGQSSQERLKGTVSKPRNLVVGIRSFTGSRTALINAAEELLASSPVMKRSGGASYQSAYLDSKESPREFVAAGYAFKSALPPEQLAGLLRAVEERLADPGQPERRQSVRLELLWVAGENVITPGLTLPSPTIAQKRWAITALVEGGENEIVESMNAGDEDRATGKRFSHYFDTIPGEPRWSGGMKDFSRPTFERQSGGLDIRVRAADAADAAAVAADMLAVAELDFRRQAGPAEDPEKSADQAFRALRAVVPEDVLPVESSHPADAPDGARIAAWVEAVRVAVAQHRTPLARTVVFEAGRTKTRGAVLVGKRVEGGLTFHRRLASVEAKPQETPTMKKITIWVRTLDGVVATKR